MEVDPEISDTAFCDFSIDGHLWHCSVFWFAFDGAPQGLRLAWIDFRLGLFVPLHK